MKKGDLNSLYIGHLYANKADDKNLANLSFSTPNNAEYGGSMNGSHPQKYVYFKTKVGNKTLVIAQELNGWYLNTQAGFKGIVSDENAQTLSEIINSSKDCFVKDILGTKIVFASHSSLPILQAMLQMKALNKC